MKKEEKVNFINEVYFRFVNSRNHGHSGNNWWYPKENTIAYCVKLYGQSVGIEDFRSLMTSRQNDYYSDNRLSEIADEHIQDEANAFSDNLDAEYGVKSGYAGRSAGWLEVEYRNSLCEVDGSHAESINELYAEAKRLDNLEAEIAEKIKQSHARLQKYLGSQEYAKDFVENLLTDDDIAEIYKGKAKDLLNKLK